MSTFLHIASATEIKFKKQLRNRFIGSEKTDSDIGVEEGLKLVRDLQAQDNSDTMSVMSGMTDGSEDGDTLSPQRDEELWNKLNKRKKQKTNQTLSRNFLKNFEKLQKVIGEDDLGSTTGRGSIQGDMEEQVPSPVEKLRHVFRTRLQRQSLHTITQLAQSRKRKEEIQKRAALVSKVSVIKVIKVHVIIIT